MSCPTCGTSASCNCKGASNSWGSTFDSWGSSSADWAKAPAGNGWKGLSSSSGSGESDGWGGGGGTATATAPPPPAPTPAPSSWLGANEEESDGWGTPAQSTPTFKREEIFQRAPEGWQTEPSEGEEDRGGWLDGGEAFKEMPLMPRTSDWVDEEVDEAWLDDEATDDEDAYDPQPAAPQGGGGGALWAAVAFAGLLLMFGLWSLNQKPAEKKGPTAAEVAAEAMQAGHRLMAAGNLSLTGTKEVKGDPEAASLQFRAAIDQLKAGGAPPTEIWDARKQLARSYVAAGKLEDGHAAWNELLAAPPHKADAAKALATVKQKLLKQADERLKEAKSLAGNGDARRAEPIALEALRLYETYGGKASQKGKAHGVIGYANLKMGKTSSAQQHLTRAAFLDPSGPYQATLNELAPVVVQTETTPVQTTTVQVSGVIDTDTGIPTGKTGLGGSVSVKQPASSGQATQTVDPGTTKTKEIAAAKKQPKPVKPKQDNSFNMKDTSGSLRM